MWLDEYAQRHSLQPPPLKESQKKFLEKQAERERERSAGTPQKKKQKKKPRQSGKNKNKETVVAVYIYKDEYGENYQRVQKTDQKSYWQGRWQPSTKTWTRGLQESKLGKLPRKLYHTDEIVKSNKKTALFLEGEKDCDLARSWGYLATTSPQGAGDADLTHNWDILSGKTVIIIPDNDDPGRKHATHVSEKLKGVCDTFRVLELPNLPEKGDLSDWAAQGGTPEKLEELIQDVLAQAPPKIKPRVVINDRDPIEVCSEVLDAIEHNQAAYSDGLRVVAISEPRVSARQRRGRKKKRFPVSLVEVGKNEIGTMISKNVLCVQQRRTKKGTFDTIVSANADLKKDTMNEGVLRLPYLRKVIETPIYDDAGTLLSSPGYDRESGLFLDSKFKVDPPRECTQQDARKAALWLFEELFKEFPFTDQAGVIHTFCCLLQPFLLLYIDAVTPAYLFRAPARGTGKSLLAEVCALVSSKNGWADVDEGRNQEEFAKTLASVMLSGPQFICMDNVQSSLKSSGLHSILTQRAYTSRLLGGNKVVDVPNQSTWMITANSPRLCKDIIRRSVTVELDAKCQNPWQRKFSRKLESWIPANRKKIVEKCLTILNAWFQAGSPLNLSGEKLGKFEEWSEIMGGVMYFLGCEDFLANVRSQADELDDEVQEWTDILEALDKRPVNTNMTARQIFVYLDGMELLPSKVLQKPKESRYNSFQRILGVSDVRYGNLYLEKVKRKNNKGNLYSVIKTDIGCGDGGRREMKENSVVPRTLEKFATKDNKLSNTPELLLLPIQGGEEFAYLRNAPQASPQHSPHHQNPNISGGCAQKSGDSGDQAMVSHETNEFRDQEDVKKHMYIKGTGSSPHSPHLHVENPVENFSDDQDLLDEIF